MLPAERGQVRQQGIRDHFAAAAQRVEGTAEIDGVPQRDDGRDQSQTTGTVLLRFDGARLHGRHARQQDEQANRWRHFPLAELVGRDRADLNLQWLQDDKATDPAALPPPGEIADELEAAVTRLRSVAARLR